MKLVPLKGSPPMPTTIDWPRPCAVVWLTASYVSVPERETMPMEPAWPRCAARARLRALGSASGFGLRLGLGAAGGVGSRMQSRLQSGLRVGAASRGCAQEARRRRTEWMYPGMMPILHSPGLMMPGQLGPIRREALWLISAFFTRTMSCCGTPSVMHTCGQQGGAARAQRERWLSKRRARPWPTEPAGRVGRGAVAVGAEAGPHLRPAAAAISGISASRASMIASAAPGGGT